MNTVIWDVFTAVSLIDVFWDLIPCGSSYNRRFGERIASYIVSLYEEVNQQ
jgi:hypothetical protein